jgi:hypothetical protein
MDFIFQPSFLGCDIISNLKVGGIKNIDAFFI